MYNVVNGEILQKLTDLVGEQGWSTAVSERELRSHDMSGHTPHMSEVVVWPKTAEQVAAILKLANDNHIPVTPWGVGSSLEGNPIPLFGGILLSLEQMTAVLTTYPDDFQVTVQPGIGYKDLNAQLSPHGLFFAPDPGANATIGGMLANNAAGIRTVKYGACKDNVLRMQVALANGRLIHVGSRSVKQSAGYDLLHLFVGSEGTLGVITEATLKLWPVPTLMCAVVATFPTVKTAIEAVVAVRGSGLEPAALEFIDAKTADILTREAGVRFGANPTLFMEFHAAHQETLELVLKSVQEICQEMEATAIQATADSTARKHLWNTRHHMFETLIRCHPGQRWIIMDVAVPMSAYPSLVAYTEQVIANQGVLGYMVGHAGDGNLHITMPFGDEDGFRKGTAVNESVVLKAIELGGTCTGEHGVGIGKAKYLPREHGTAVNVMQAIKHTLDPNGILNPGKVLQ